MGVSNPGSGGTPDGTLQQVLWRPAGVVAESFNAARFASQGIFNGLTSGRLYLTGGVVIPAGKTVSSIGIASSSTAAVTPTNQWFCLVRASDLAVLALSVDDLANAWPVSTLKTLALSAALTVLANTPVFVGVCVVAATPPSLLGYVSSGISNVALSGQAPLSGGNSTNGLTTPASCPANVASPSNQAQGFYAQLS